MLEGETTIPEVEVLRCTACGTLDPGPRELCANCASDALVPHRVPGRGTLVSWTVIRRPPAKFKAEGAFAVAVIDLDEGVRITARLREGEDCEPGTPVIVKAYRGGIAYFGRKTS
jgi:uncharacterized OB-fold protein